MKYILIHTLAALAMLAATDRAMAAPPQYNFAFAETTPLASGKWVKISIDETGLYEISYDRLKEMGFSNPSNVAIYGKGGSLLEYNFTDSKGNPLYSDTLQATPVLHTGDKVIFYGYGQQTLIASPLGYSNKRFRHRRKDKNIYSDRSYYLLTDSQEPLAPQPNHVNSKADAIEMATGYGYVYHERDLRHNEHTEGQVFWGEEAYIGKPVVFPIERKYCKDATAYIWLEFANANENGGQVAVTLGGYKTTSAITNMPANIYTLGTSNEQVRLSVTDNHVGVGELSIGVEGNYPDNAPLAIDYWTLSYPINLEYAKNDPEFASQYIAFMESSKNRWKHPVPDNSVVWDVTDGQLPVELDVEEGYFYNNARYTSEVIAFNPERKQLDINPDWEEIAPQDLHALQQEPAALVILTLPRLKAYAERLARIHEEHGTGKTIVVTPDEIYNEFNHGTPDVTALRAFVKMLYQKHPDTLKNVLVFGNVYGDYRNVNGHPDRPDGLPIYMVPTINLKSSEGAEGSASNDYLGVMTDYMNATGMLGNISVEVGVGLLPISSFEEAEIAVQKVDNYLKKEDFSNLVNEFMTICDSGDSHIHDFQAFKLANMYNEFAQSTSGSQFAVSPLWSEKMGKQKVHDTMLSSLRRGKLFTTYYGHATAAGFGNITFQDFQRLDNDEPAFFFMAGCDLCEPDRMIHGAGDIGVIRNTRGLMATICGTRSVLSHENQALSENFTTAMFYDAASAPRTQTPTIGEIYALAKTNTNNVSKQGFMLIGDPAIPLPIALRKVKVEADRNAYRGGEVMEISGEVLDNVGDCDASYNGYATIKLMEPATEEAIVADPLDDDGNIKPNPRLRINDYRLASVRTEVKEGRFRARLNLPSKLDNFLSTPDSIRTVNVLVGTFSPEKFIGASGKLGIIMPQAGTDPDPEALTDNSAPIISITHDDGECLLTVIATDDCGIAGESDKCGLTLKIDGNPVKCTTGLAKDMVTDRLEIPVSTAHLSTGTHTAVATAVDLAGNRSAEKTYKFTISSYNPFSLQASSSIVIDELSLKATGKDCSGLTYLITDLNGNLIESGECEADGVILDVTGYAPATYRAALREESSRGTKIYSNWVEFTKID